VFSLICILVYTIDMLLLLFLFFFVVDGRFTRHVQSPIYIDSRVTQGLEAPPRTSTSHLATDHGSRPPVAQSRSELSLATRSELRTMEATRGNGYVPVRGMPVMMMMMMFLVEWRKRPHNQGFSLYCVVRSHVFESFDG